MQFIPKIRNNRGSEALAIYIQTKKEKVWVEGVDRYCGELERLGK